ncbi:M1 family metallopeptidase [Opitutaceae bacterium]|nr:M1 family metallopeptidase [Opitutaceae bacterium]MDB4474074.1 M1 family metallopeptidase [Opitutaceae bacterium]
MIRYLLPLLTFATLLSAEAPFSFDSNAGHLPKTIVPTHYSVRLEMDLPNRAFTGHVRTEITARETVDTIVLSANALEIAEARMITDSGAVVLPTTYDAETQQLSLHPSALLVAGDYIIELDYTGSINPNAEGFFFDRYTTPDGDKELFGTQCEVPDARRILPCWDEPAFKATFSSTLVVPEKFAVSSNMPAIRESSLGDGRKEVEFATSPLMSTYLLAYFGGEFEILEDMHRGVKLRIFTTEGKSQNGAYALEATKLVLDYFTDYFGVAYPLPQLDQIAIPNAFSGFGAMENWGAISYMETLLLYDPATSSQSTKENVFNVIAHEVAHQWFGNIVTMGWWDNLWLNEAFASWIDTKSTHDLNPDWNYWLKSNPSKEYALGLDARLATHPIQLPGVTEYGAIDAFDAIAYNKGQAFVRMLEDYLGERDFRAGIRLYMQRHAWSNTTTEDLWTALEDASGQPVREIASGWTLQSGFPVITATRDQSQLRLRQELFSIDDPNPPATMWSIPVSAAPLDNLAVGQKHLLADREIVVPWADTLGAPKINLNDVGFYRVVYDQDTFAAIVAALPDLPAAEQINLLGDTWALVSAGRVSATAFLEIAWALRDNSSDAVWRSILTALIEIDIWMLDRPERDDFHRWSINLLRPQIERLGWKPKSGESTADANLRSSIVYRLGIFGDQDAIVESQNQFSQYLEDPASIDGNMRPVVINVVGRYADEATYNRLWELYQKAINTEEKNALIRGMQHALDRDLAARTRELTLGEELPAAHRNYNLFYVSSRGEHLEETWAFTKEHAAELLAPLARYGANSYLGYIVNRSSDPAIAAELEAVQVQHRGEDALAEAQKTSGAIRLRARTRERELPGLSRWLKVHTSPSN